MSNILNKINKILSAELQSMDVVIKQNVFSDNKLLNDVIQHTQRMNGKRMRVLLTLLVGKIYNYSELYIVKIATAIELIHNATLLHDDVIDNNTKRRGISAANKLWANKICVLSGDFLLSKAFSLISSANNNAISALISEASSVLIDGEVRQIIFNNSDDLSYRNYISIIEAKTAALFSTATAVAPLFVNAPKEEIKALKDFGNYIGIAFQICDDLLDYLGTSKVIGKPIGIDFKEKKMTLPTIILKDKLLKEGKQDLWNSLWGSRKFKRESLRQIILELKKYNVAEIVKEYMLEYIDMAKNSIKIIKYKQPYVDLLDELVDFIVSRNV